MIFVKHTKLPYLNPTVLENTIREYSRVYSNPMNQMFEPIYSSPSLSILATSYLLAVRSPNYH